MSMVFSPNKTDRHDITEILLKVALNTITLTPNPLGMFPMRTKWDTYTAYMVKGE
jgi:hypothetical protein